MINQMEPWFGQEEIDALLQYMQSGGWLTEHTKTTELEGMIAEYTGARHCIMVCNGTAALFCAIKGSGLVSGEVIVPNFTMGASPASVVLAGLKPVFVDIDPQTLCLNLDLVEQAITSNTSGIMVVEINGRYPDLDKLVEIASRHSLYLIEDAAQTLGSSYKGKHLGTFGMAGALSFSWPKAASTGQGGAVLTDDNWIAERIRHLKDFGRARYGEDQYDEFGWNFKFTDLQAVIGIEQMKKLPWRVQRKKEMYVLYRSLLDGIIEFIPTNLNNTSPMFIDVLVNDRDGLMKHLADNGIGSRKFYPALHSQKAYGLSGNFPISEDVARRGLWLPSSSFLTDNQIVEICDVIRLYDKPSVYSCTYSQNGR